MWECCVPTTHCMCSSFIDLLMFTNCDAAVAVRSFSLDVGLWKRCGRGRGGEVSFLAHSQNVIIPKRIVLGEWRILWGHGASSLAFISKPHLFMIVLIICRSSSADDVTSLNCEFSACVLCCCFTRTLWPYVESYCNPSHNKYQIHSIESSRNLFHAECFSKRVWV
jgi:hypothetical protein